MNNRSTLTDAEMHFVQNQRVARLATSDEQGNPHLIPVCYAFDGTYFFTPLDEKPKRVSVTSLRRVHNIEARHEVALLIDQYNDDWSKLGYILVHGRADLLAPGAPQHTSALVLLRERYVQYRNMALETLPVIVITPERIVAWGPAIQS
jgi:PPOX class probable F420-dependent enzyme